MKHPKIKICGVKDPQIAYDAAKAGADFIGLIFVPYSKRLVTLELGREIIHSTRLANAEPVAVFAEESVQQISEICQLLSISHVQLHGQGSRLQQHLLPAELHRIYVCDIADDGEIKSEDLKRIKNLNYKRDFLLFDSNSPGSGNAFNWENFSYTGEFRWFLAGGLNIANVKQAIKQLQPYAVDVSTGVESSPGQKDRLLINQFIQEARSLCY